MMDPPRIQGTKGLLKTWRSISPVGKDTDPRLLQHFVFNLFGLRERYAWAIETVDHPAYGEIPKGLDEMIKVYEQDPRYREMERDYVSQHALEMSVWEYVVASLESAGEWDRIEYLNAEGEVERASEYSAADRMGIMCAIMLDPKNFKSMPGTAIIDVIAAPPTQLPIVDVEGMVAGGGEDHEAMVALHRAAPAEDAPEVKWTFWQTCPVGQVNEQQHQDALIKMMHRLLTSRRDIPVESFMLANVKLANLNGGYIDLGCPDGRHVVDTILIRHMHAYMRDLLRKDPAEYTPILIRWAWRNEIPDELESELDWFAGTHGLSGVDANYLAYTLARNMWAGRLNIGNPSMARVLRQLAAWGAWSILRTSSRGSVTDLDDRLKSEEVRLGDARLQQEINHYTWVESTYVNANKLLVVVEFEQGKLLTEAQCRQVSYFIAEHEAGRAVDSRQVEAVQHTLCQAAQSRLYLYSQFRVSEEQVSACHNMHSSADARRCYPQVIYSLRRWLSDPAVRERITLPSDVWLARHILRADIFGLNYQDKLFLDLARMIPERLWTEKFREKTRDFSRQLSLAGSRGYNMLGCAISNAQLGLVERLLQDWQDKRDAVPRLWQEPHSAHPAESRQLSVALAISGNHQAIVARMSEIGFVSPDADVSLHHPSGGRRLFPFMPRPVLMLLSYPYSTLRRGLVSLPSHEPGEPADGWSMFPDHLAAYHGHAALLGKLQILGWSDARRPPSWLTTMAWMALGGQIGLLLASLREPENQRMLFPQPADGEVVGESDKLLAMSRWLAAFGAALSQGHDIIASALWNAIPEDMPYRQSYYDNAVRLAAYLGALSWLKQQIESDTPSVQLGSLQEESVPVAFVRSPLIKAIEQSLQEWLHALAECQDADLVRGLVEGPFAGYASFSLLVEARNVIGQTALMRAVTHGTAQAWQHYYAPLFPELSHMTDDKGRNVLHLLAERPADHDRYALTRCVFGCELLRELWWLLNAYTHDNRTPLQIAAKCGNLVFLRCVLRFYNIDSLMTLLQQRGPLLSVSRQPTALQHLVQVGPNLGSSQRHIVALWQWRHMARVFVATSAIKIAALAEPVGSLFLLAALQHFGLRDHGVGDLNLPVDEAKEGRVAIWHDMLLIPTEEHREAYIGEEPSNLAPFCRTVAQLHEQYRAQDGVGVLRTSQVFGLMAYNSPDVIMSRLAREMLEEGRGSPAELALAACAAEP